MRVLVTGASGTIGSDFARLLSDPDLQLVQTDVAADPPDVEQLDVTDVGACARAVRNIDAVLHLAADPSPTADFRSSVLPVNIVGTYNLVEAAVTAGVQRFVFASSIHAVAGYPPDQQVREQDPPRPANDYGVGKAFGEALCAAAAIRSTTTFVAVRIGNYSAERPGGDPELRDRMLWLSARDAAQLLRQVLTVPVDGFHIAHGVSNNAATRLALDLTRTTFGYRPSDDAFEGSPRRHDNT